MPENDNTNKNKKKHTQTQTAMLAVEEKNLIPRENEKKQRMIDRNKIAKLLFSFSFFLPSRIFFFFLSWKNDVDASSNFKKNSQ